jgi:hypothetical protein
MGPYVVGFDTLGFYIPNILAWLRNGVDLGGFSQLHHYFMQYTFQQLLLLGLQLLFSK